MSGHITSAEQIPGLRGARASLHAGTPSDQGRVSSAWDNVERLLVRVGDWLNPILVKETRQALKSFQFTITFVIVLVACWIVTMAVVAVIGPRIFYAADGGVLLAWYYAVLALPLTVVVPLAAYRSLLAEQEDNTYDLLSITTLKPRQIISGKLGSSIVQMGVYFSAVAPCLAFTYLLRGIDLPTIAVLLLYSFFWSLGLSMLGLLLATLNTQRFVQVFILVLFVAFLLLMFYSAIYLGYGAGVYGQVALGGLGEQFWIFTAAIGTVYFTFFALAFFAATSRISFSSENKSTPLRVCMFVQQAAFIGWLGYTFMSTPSGFIDLEIVMGFAMFGGMYWYAMGTLLTSERPNMSRRVMRGLPQSFAGRALLSWFNPGPTNGYMFAVANASAVAVLCLLFAGSWVYLLPAGSVSMDFEQLFCMIVVGWGFLVAYLGLGLFLIRVLRQIATVTMLAGVLINALLLLAGFGVPNMMKSMSLQLRDVDYTFLQITDPIFSLYHISRNPLPPEAIVLVMVVPCAAICMLLINMPAIVREIQKVRLAAPKRVVEDEADLHPPPEKESSNPWDEPEPRSAGI